MSTRTRTAHTGRSRLQLPRRRRRLWERRGRHGRRGDDRGSVTVELALGYFPVMLLAILALVAVTRIVSAQMDVNAAAAAAARQASLTYNPAAARTAADDAATASLTGRGVTCSPHTATVDAADLTPGGAVTVTIGCTVRLRDLIGLKLPGSLHVSGDATQPVDAYRSQP